MDSTTIIGIAAGALVVLVVLFIAARKSGAKTAGPAKRESPHPSAPFPIPDAPPSSRVPSKPPPKKTEETPPPSSAPAPSVPVPSRPPPKAEPTSSPIDLRSDSEPPGPLDRPPTQPPPIKAHSEPPVSADREPISIEPISVKPLVNDKPLDDEDDAKTELRMSPIEGGDETPIAAPVAQHTAETVKPPPPPPARPSDRHPVSPRVPPPARPLPPPKQATPVRPIEAKKAEPPPKVEPAAKKDEHDFSALNEAPAKPVEKPVVAPKAAYTPPTNPATADLEKSDPRHASARRFARVAVSEIKLYHEAEVKAGREAKDLWTRLSADIGLAKQTYEQRVDKEVRERFDYLFDEILRQLAEGEHAKLGPNAPTKGEPVDHSKVTAPLVTKEPAAPAAIVTATAAVPHEPPTKKIDIVAEAPPPPKAEPKPDPKPEPKIPADAKATLPGVTPQRYAPPTNPETAELEKNDSRHSAARRFARVAVSEIKLYHEAEVKAGREAKDLWTRLSADIGLAKQTYEARVDKEVRGRFDYLFDEILRQLAEGDIEKLGPNAPKKAVLVEETNKVSERKVPAAAPVETKVEAKVEPKVEAKVEPKVEAKAPEAPAPAPPPPTPVKEAAKPPPAATPADAKTAQPSAISKYLPPSNPATAELEKSDPRHAAARRLARLSVSEIKLYHEEEVKVGRTAKDLWRRLSTDIGLATQTYEKRVDKEVRERFDYLYDEILRQLAEGDADKLGPGAPKGKNA